MRKLKHHEQKLLKKVNFYDWKSDANIREVKILRKYHIDDREDYTKYNKVAGLVTKLVAQLRKMKASDEDRIKMTKVLLEKLYSMGLIPNTQSLEDCVSLPTSAFCRRRLPVVLCRMRFCESLHEAVTFIQQGHIRIGPDIVTNPAVHMTRDMEDHVTWAEGSKVKRNVKEFNEQGTGALPHARPRRKGTIALAGIHGESSLVQRLCLGMQSLSLCRLAADGDEALDAQSLLGSLHGCGPATDPGRVALLARLRLRLGDDLPGLALHQLVLGQPGLCLRLAASEDHCLGQPALCDDRDLHRLHGYGLHGFGLHGLGLHGLGLHGLGLHGLSLHGLHRGCHCPHVRRVQQGLHPM